MWGVCHGKISVPDNSQVYTVQGSSPNGYRREDYALEKPTDELKSATYTLTDGECRNVHITEDLGGQHSQRAIESSIYTRVTTDGGWVSVSLASAQSNECVTAPRTKNFGKYISYVYTVYISYLVNLSYWPDLLICNIGDNIDGGSNVDITVEYANGTTQLTPLATLLMISTLYLMK